MREPLNLRPSVADVPEVRTSTRHQAARRGLPWRPLAAVGVVGAVGVAWVLAPGPLGQRIGADQISAVVSGQGEPLPVASGFEPLDAASVAQPSSSGVPALPPAAAMSPDAAPAEPPATVAVPSVPAPPAATALPEDARGEIPRQGPGTFQPAAGGTGVVGTGDTLVTYSVEIEDGLPLDAAAVAARVDEILGDPRSWIGLGRWQLQRVDGGADARIVVASPGTTDNLCYPLQTGGRYSCRNGPFVVLNADRWAGGAPSWGAEVAGYRGYLVNHEFGHFLGFSHTPCPAAGSPAPVMLQQTKGLSGCTANAWPTVTGG